MGRKRKSKGGRTGATGAKRKTAGVEQVDGNAAVVDATGIGGPSNSDDNEPQVEGIVNVELKSKWGTSVDGNNQQEDFDESSNQVLVFDPDIDTGGASGADVKNELKPQFEDGDGMDSSATNDSKMTRRARDPKVGGGLTATAPGSKSSAWKLSRMNSFPGSEIGPLQNTAILHHFFQLCPISILASCRLVCKQWYDESLLIWRTEFPVTIAKREPSMWIAKRHSHQWELGGFITFRTPLNEFLEFNENPQSQCISKPFRNVEIADEFSLNSEHFKIFWKIIGINLNNLDLSKCTFSTIDEFRKIIYKCCPVLQTLEIRHCNFPVQDVAGREEHHKLQYIEPLFEEHKHLKTLNVFVRLRESEEFDFPVSWLELFSHFPLLTSCDISCAYKFPEAEFETLIKAIKTIRKVDKKKLPFKCFSFFHNKLVISRNSKSHRQFSLAKDVGLPLVGCYIKVHPELDQSFVRNTLRYLAPSVKTIALLAGYEEELGGTAGTPTWFRDFPFGIQLDNLTSLDASYSDFCGNLTFLKCAPNLSSLKISDRYYYLSGGVLKYKSANKVVFNSYLEELANVEMRRLASLNLDFLVSDTEILQLFKWMPHVTILSMVLSDTQFALVCQNWKNIRKLWVPGGSLTAEGVTRMENGRAGQDVGIRPNIAKLNCLASLYFNLDITFTPNDVFHLFLHVQSLQSFYFDGVSVERENLDMSSYQQAIQDNLVEQWIADNGNRWIGRSNQATSPSTLTDTNGRDTDETGTEESDTDETDRDETDTDQSWEEVDF